MLYSLKYRNTKKIGYWNGFVIKYDFKKYENEKIVFHWYTDNQ